MSHRRLWVLVATCAIALCSGQGFAAAAEATAAFNELVALETPSYAKRSADEFPLAQAVEETDGIEVPSDLAKRAVEELNGKGGHTLTPPARANNISSFLQIPGPFCKNVPQFHSPPRVEENGSRNLSDGGNFACGCAPDELVFDIVDNARDERGTRKSRKKLSKRRRRYKPHPKHKHPDDDSSDSSSSDYSSGSTSSESSSSSTSESHSSSSSADSSDSSSSSESSSESSSAEKKHKKKKPKTKKKKKKKKKKHKKKKKSNSESSESKSSSSESGAIHKNSRFALTKMRSQRRLGQKKHVPVKNPAFRTSITSHSFIADYDDGDEGTAANSTSLKQ